MAIRVGSANVTDIKVGGTSVDKVMVGSNVVWERSNDTRGGVWRGTFGVSGNEYEIALTTDAVHGQYQWTDNVFFGLVLKNNRNATWDFVLGEESFSLSAPSTSKSISYGFISSSYGECNINIDWSAS